MANIQILQCTVRGIGGEVTSSSSVFKASHAKYFYVCIILFWLFPIASAASEKWVDVGVIEVKPRQSKVAFVDNLAIDSIVRVKDGGLELGLYSTPQERGLGAILVLPASDVARSFTVSVKRLYSLDKEYSAELHEFDLSKDSHKYSGLLQAQTAMRAWQVNTHESRNNALGEMSNAFISLKDDHDFGLTIAETYFEMLLHAEQHEQLLELIDSSSVYPSGLQDSSNYRIGWLKARSQYALEKIEEASETYKSLLTSINHDKDLGIESEIDMVEALGEYGGLLLLKGFFSGNINELEQGRRYLNEALDVAIRSKEKKLEANLLNDISLSYSLKGDYELSEASLLRSISLHRSVGESLDLSQSLNNLAFNYNRLGKKDVALSLLNQALEIEAKYPFRSQKANMILIQSSIYKDLGKYDLAILQAARAKKYFDKVGNVLGSIEASNIVGKSHRLNGEPKLAIDNLGDNLETLKSLGPSLEKNLFVVFFLRGI